MASLTGDELQALSYDWPFWARESQLPPRGAWRVWLILAGRGFGKTRCGAEWVRAQVATGCGRMALVAATAADARDVMVEGESGILAISPPWHRPLYEPSKRRLTWPNGAVATTYSADEPDRLRGPQHDGAWCDELAAWRYAAAWDNLMLGLRLGDDPRCVVTTTPRPIKVIRDLIANAGCTLTKGSTYDNRANLAPGFFADIVARYEGTRLGRQELYADVLDDVPGALWQRAWFDRGRLTEAPLLRRVVVAVDPPAGSTENSDECGIVAAGEGQDGKAYILADRSTRGTPNTWAGAAVRAYHEFGADRLVAEVNQGGDMVEAVIRQVDADVSYKGVHASRGKAVRAEPIAALYEQARVGHVGPLDVLEDQMCAFTTDFDRDAAGYSPDRLDAAVWALTELMFAKRLRPKV